MALPNFYIPGAQKCATTWLAAMLRQHPEVFIPGVKEIDYYNRAGNYTRGRAWYERHFENAGGAKAVGDATPHYLPVTSTKEECCKVIDRLLALTPHARFIVAIRNPVTRAVSSLLHAIRGGYVSPWANLDVEFDSLLAGRHSLPHVLEFGRYGGQVRAFMQHFPVERFEFVVYEQDVRTNRRETLQRMCRFLGIRADFAFRDIDRRMNTSLSTRGGLLVAQLPYRKAARTAARWIERTGIWKAFSISQDTRRRLADYYTSDIEELSRLIGRDLGAWHQENYGHNVGYETQFAPCASPEAPTTP